MNRHSPRIQLIERGSPALFVSAHLGVVRSNCTIVVINGLLLLAYNLTVVRIYLPIVIVYRPHDFLAVSCNLTIVPVNFPIILVNGVLLLTQ
ncbi:MAG: hypothetical protein RIE23_07760 [Pontimonas sp.]